MHRASYVTRALLLAAVAATPIVLVAATSAVSHAAAAAVYYVAPNGNDSAAGTQAAPWASIVHAQTVAQAGDTVYFRGGAYAYTRANSTCTSQTARVDAITLNKSGTSGSPIRYWAYQGERPVFDFSRLTEDCRIKGFDVTGNYIYLKGLEVTGVRQNNNLNHESWGIWISGSNNTFEQLNVHHIMGTGLFINGGGGNLVLNSDSHDNYDSRSSNGAGESGDGFGAHYMPAGSASNVFRGCRAWNNSDDGFDLIDAYAPVLIDSSWAFKNGYVPGSTTAAGNGNGFKAGSSKTGVRHIIRGSLAWKNVASGFYANHSSGGNDWFNNTSYNNGTQYNMLASDPSDSSVTIILMGTLVHKMRNNIGFPNKNTNMTGVDTAFNTWDLNLVPAAADFASVTDTGFMGARQADGSLPNIDFMKLPAGSKMIDKGTDVGLGFAGAAPDLGAFEYGVVSAGGTGSGGAPSAGGALGAAGSTAKGGTTGASGSTAAGGAAGASGSGTAVGTAGASNAGGNQAAGGNPGSGGSATASGGSGAPTDSPSNDANSASGCGCKITGGGSGFPPVSAVLPLLGALALLRRRRARKCVARRNRVGEFTEQSPRAPNGVDQARFASIHPCSAWRAWRLGGWSPTASVAPVSRWSEPPVLRPSTNSTSETTPAANSVSPRTRSQRRVCIVPVCKNSELRAYQ